MFTHIWNTIRLIYKGFLSGIFNKHYSQFGEDIVLREILKKEICQGFYVDVGCYHPKKFSNTYMLYRKGWSGINIDMEKDKIFVFNIVRPRDYNILSPVSDKKEIVTLYKYSKYGLGSTINEDFADNINDEVLSLEKVETKTLNEIIEASPYKGQQIDVLSVDVEGMDYKIIRSLNFNVYLPKIIIIEDHHTSIDEILETEIYKLLTQHSYILRSWTFYSLIFILPNSNILKERELKKKITKCTVSKPTRK